MAFEGLIAGVIALGVAIYVIVTVFASPTVNAVNAGVMNTGLYSTITTTILPLAVLAVVAAFIIGVFGARGE